jgi:hypothetical protein
LQFCGGFFFTTYGVYNEKINSRCSSSNNAASVAVLGAIAVVTVSTSPPLVVYIPKVTGPTLVDKDRASVLCVLT